MKFEQISLTGGGQTRDEAMKSVYKQLEQYAPGRRWDRECVTAKAQILGRDGSVTLWTVEASFERTTP